MFFINNTSGGGGGIVWFEAIFLLVLGFCLAKVYFQRIIGENELNPPDQKKLLKLEHKDYFYILLIFSLLFIMWIAAKLGDDEYIVQVIGFAGTLTSIILGLVAIIYSMLQGASSSNHQQDLTNISKKLSEVVKQLDDQVEKSEKLVNEIENTNKALINQIDNLENKLNKNMEEIEKLRKQVSSAYFEKDINAEQENSIDIEEFLKKYDIEI